ncbi:MAG: IS630 family transposase [Chloroflexota bacterium]|nr:IS630 family transposase [Chloroflexota bacterium]
MILAEDEASLYLQATTMRVWAPRGQAPVVAADPGRAKTSFYGTLNLHTGAEIVTQADTMNAEATARHLEQVLATHPDVPLLLLWDRAPWHRGEPIRVVLAANPRLEIMVLPVAAPDLNPQEHVWKATREAVSHNHRDKQLATLAERFKGHLTTTIFPTSFLEHRGFYTIHPRSN